MATRAMNSRVSPEVIWGPRSDQATRIGRRGSPWDRTKRSGVSSCIRFWSSSAWAKASCTWGGGQLGGEQVVDLVAGHDIDNGQAGPAAAAELGAVPHPDLVRCPADRLGPRQGEGRPLAEWRLGQLYLVFRGDSAHCGGSHEHLAHVAAAMRQFAVGAVNLAPFLDDLEDRVLLPGQQPVHRVAARNPVLEAAHLVQPGPPPMRPHVAHAQQSVGVGVRPAASRGVVDQLQQGFLHLTGDTGWNRQGQAQAQRGFPRTSDNSIASSLSASVSRAFSARSSSMATSAGVAGRPGFDDANATIAASLATLRNLITVASTRHLRAASRCVNSPVVTSTNTCHFSSGDNCRRRWRGSVLDMHPSSGQAPSASRSWDVSRWTLYHELRRTGRRRVATAPSQLPSTARDLRIE